MAGKRGKQSGKIEMRKCPVCKRMAMKRIKPECWECMQCKYVHFPMVREEVNEG